MKGAIEEIRIVHTPLDMEEVGRIWGTFNQPYRRSAAYEVSVVQLDMLAASTQRLPGRVRSIGVPETDVPFRPPLVTAMTPTTARRERSCASTASNWRAGASICA